MFKQFIDKVDGADVYMVGSFVTFMVFFALVSVYLLISDKKTMQKMAEMPLN
jgi:hypothetical protein